jgi:hypothetical protein
MKFLIYSVQRERANIGAIAKSCSFLFNLWRNALQGWQQWTGPKRGSECLFLKPFNQKMERHLLAIF